jgi:acyl carrier protein
VKLRGYRIELGEIQAQLDRHPAVRESVVQLATGSLEPRLVAFVETWGRNVTAGELHAFLRSVLPDYMIPAQFMVLAAFPRSPHGKVDLALLSEQNAFAEEKGETYIPPRDAREQRLAEIWCAVLHLERVGVRSSFFALGGHSLLVMQVIARIRDAFAVDVSFRTFFDSPIIEDLAKAIQEIRERNPNSAPAAIPRLTRVARRGLQTYDPH